jgi:hypothetical protein
MTSPPAAVGWYHLVLGRLGNNRDSVKTRRQYGTMGAFHFHTAESRIELGSCARLEGDQRRRQKSRD